MKAAIHTLLAVVTVGATMSHAAPITLFNTGVDDTGTQLALGASDPHWTIVSGPGISSPVQAAVLDQQHPYGHYTESPFSLWIGLAPDGAGSEPYTVRLTFDLTGLDPTTAVITGQWGADDSGSIRLNGQDSGIGTGTLSSPELSGPANFDVVLSFTLNQGFLPTTNTLDFVIANPYGDVTGLSVTSLSGTASVLVPSYALTIRVSEVEPTRVSQVALCWPTVTNTWYQLQNCSSLAANQWVPLSGTWITGDGAQYCTNDAVPVGTPQRFYRLSVTNSPPQ